MPYGTESKSRNADFILIAQEGDTTTLGAKGPVKLKNLKNFRAGGPSTFTPQGVSNGALRPPQVSSFLSPRFTANRFRLCPVSFMRASTEGRPVSSSAFRTMYSQALASSKAW